ncbi:MAG: FHA domain-containing protein [Candidatus Bruticola sp.]
MAEQSDIFSKLKDGLGLASKLAGKGVSEVSGMLKHDDSSRTTLSGVYWNRGTWNTTVGLSPEVDFFESQVGKNFASGMMQRLTLSKAERLFGQACSSLICIETDQAVGYLREAVQLDTQFTDAYFMLGCVLLELGNASEAVSFFQKALLCQQGLGVKLKKYLPSFRVTLPLTPWSSVALFPDLLGVNILLALSWRRADNLTMAISVLEQIMSILPTSVLAKFFMGILRLEAGQYNEVITLFSSWKTESTIEAACLLLAGKAYQKIRSISVIADLYDQAVARSDIDMVIRYDLLLAQSEVGLSYNNNYAQVKAQIMRECPQYKSFFERLDIKVGGQSAQPKLASAGSNGSEAANSVVVSSGLSKSGAPAVSGSVAEVLASGNAGTDRCPIPVAAVSPTSSVSAVGTEHNVAEQVSVYVPPIPAPVALPSVSEGATVKMGVPSISSTAASVSDVAPVSEADFLNLQLSYGALGRIYPLTAASAVIGRESGDIVVSNESSISYIHARISKSAANGHCYIEDLDSTNGTWLNGVRLAANQKYELKRGDSVTLGRAAFKLM